MLAYHVAAVSGHSPHNLAIAQLKAGVTVFFVLSGFLLYLPYAEALERGERPAEWRGYAARRAARILPAYWTALVVWLAISPLGAGHVETGGPAITWWRYFGLVQSYQPGTIPRGLSVAWSLSVEVAFYAALPVLARALALAAATLRQRRPATSQLRLLALLGAASLAARSGLAPSLTAPVSDRRIVLATSLPMLFDWFAVGMALAIVVATWWGPSPEYTRIRALGQRASVCYGAAAILFAEATPIQGGDMFLSQDSLAAHAILGVAAALLLLPAVTPGRARSLTVAFASKPMRWLGTISYGIYLWHLPVLVLFRGLITGLPITVIPRVPLGAGTTCLLLVATLVGAIGLGALSWYIIERPVIRAANRLAPRGSWVCTDALPVLGPDDCGAPAR